jgi:hypothetical protein
MPSATSTIRVDGLTRLWEVVTEPGYGTQTRGPWAGLVTCESSLPLVQPASAPLLPSRLGSTDDSAQGAGGRSSRRTTRAGGRIGLKTTRRRRAGNLSRRTTRPAGDSAGGRLGRRTTWPARLRPALVRKAARAVAMLPGRAHPGREKPGAAGVGASRARRSEPAGSEIGPGRRLYQKNMRHRFKLVGFQCQVQRRRFRAAAAR